MELITLAISAANCCTTCEWVKWRDAASLWIVLIGIIAGLIWMILEVNFKK